MFHRVFWSPFRFPPQLFKYLIRFLWNVNELFLKLSSFHSLNSRSGSPFPQRHHQSPHARHLLTGTLWVSCQLIGCQSYSFRSHQLKILYHHPNQKSTTFFKFLSGLFWCDRSTKVVLRYPSWRCNECNPSHSVCWILWPYATAVAAVWSTPRLQCRWCHEPVW